MGWIGQFVSASISLTSALLLLVPCTAAEDAQGKDDTRGGEGAHPLSNHPSPPDLSMTAPSDVNATVPDDSQSIGMEGSNSLIAAVVVLPVICCLAVTLYLSRGSWYQHLDAAHGEEGEEGEELVEAVEDPLLDSMMRQRHTGGSVALAKTSSASTLKNSSAITTTPGNQFLTGTQTTLNTSMNNMGTVRSLDSTVNRPAPTVPPLPLGNITRGRSNTTTSNPAGIVRPPSSLQVPGVQNRARSGTLLLGRAPTPSSPSPRRRRTRDRSDSGWQNSGLGGLPAGDDLFTPRFYDRNNKDVTKKTHQRLKQRESFDSASGATCSPMLESSDPSPRLAVPEVPSYSSSAQGVSTFSSPRSDSDGWGDKPLPQRRRVGILSNSFASPTPDNPFEREMPLLASSLTSPKKKCNGLLVQPLPTSLKGGGLLGLGPSTPLSRSGASYSSLRKASPDATL